MKAKAKPKKKPRRVVLGVMDLRTITEGNTICRCVPHRLYAEYLNFPLGHKIRLVAEVLK